MCEQQPPDLSVIIVSWNVRDLLCACLRSLRASPNIALQCDPLFPIGDRRAETRGPRRSVEVVVVDNASADGSAAAVAAEFPWVRLVVNTENRGFTGGNNQGVALSRGRYVLFLNPDTEVVGDALQAMVSFMDAHPEVGALGPQLRYADGKAQSSRRRFPTFGMALFESTPLAWHWPPAANPWARRYHMADVPPLTPSEGGDEAQPVDWVVGAALLASRAVLDQGYFMYSEELDWCRRASGAGWKIVYLPGAQVIHHEGKSSEQVVAARHIRFQTSKIRYFRKFHGAAAAEALRIFLLAAFALEWMLEGAKWLLGSRRSLRRERLSAYGQLLRTGLRPPTSPLRPSPDGVPGQSAGA
jgi:N-acetylglucosaminyl-diphospho-decaprenol L-rhamnosyltransferase